MPLDQRTLIVLDDDPTGTQSVHDLPVLTRWEVQDLAEALNERPAAVYVLTNTRSLGPEAAAARDEEIARNALDAAADLDLQLAFVSRSDSTLRGHFPLETDVLDRVLREVTGHGADVLLLVPAFPEAGRVTIGGTHYLRGAGGALLPAGDSEFASDATFGYTASHLPDWVEEKTEGAVQAAAVQVLDLDLLRGGAQGVAQELLGDRTDGGEAPRVVVADAENEDDLRALAAGLDLAESQGLRVIYRVGPPFVRARIGQQPRTPLTAEEVYGDADGGPENRMTGGLIVVGSHVGLTTRQLDRLRAEHRTARTVELDVPLLLEDSSREEHLGNQVAEIAEALASTDVIVHTSRTLVRTEDGEGSLRIARAVSSAVVETVQRVLAEAPPRFVIAKGGITSSDVAAHGLQIRRAVVRGPMLPGIVSLWQAVDGPARGIPYVVFAGNVGDDESLLQVTRTLSTVAGKAAERSGDATPPAATPSIAPARSVAVLGLGAMGLPMATCLAAAEPTLEVRGFDISAERMGLAASAGVRTTESAREAVSGADAVLLAVRNGAQLESVLFGDDGIAQDLREGSVVILTSTVGIDPVAATAERLAESGVGLVDAPLSGGPVRAGDGDLLIVVGARPSDLEIAQPVLDALSSTLTVVGEKPGDGQALKTVNQLLCGVHIAAAAEALALADSLGLDRGATLDALQSGAAASFMLGNRGPRMLEAYEEGGADVLSRLDIFVKDLGIVTDAAQVQGLPTPVAAAAQQLFLLGAAQGKGALDDSAVITALSPELRARSEDQDGQG